LGDFLVGGGFVFEAPITLSNGGDTVANLYHDVVDVYVERSITVPAGLSASVHVGAAEAPATVTVTPDGQPPMVHGAQPAGAVVAASGPVTIAVTSLASLAASEERLLSAVFDIGCDAPGTFGVTLAATAAGFPDVHVRDPVAENDALSLTEAVDCVLPVAINIRPGNPGNQVQSDANQRVPVAVLTTAAGEYGLPVAFDGADVIGPEARFGTLAELQAGGGSSPWKDEGVLRDAHELDEVSKDGDDDRVFNFPVPDSGITPGTTEACVMGTYAAPGGPFVFLGCDAVAAW
jgi:hypothetical protein